MLSGCQSLQEKNALFLKERVERLQPKTSWTARRCEVKAELSAPQAVKYRTAFPDETGLLDNWQATYDWSSRESKCQIHVQPLTPLTANQRAFVEEAFCTLLQVFYVHSPFEGIRILPTDMIDQEGRLFLRQRADSEVGIYLDKAAMNIETQTARNGVYKASYVQHDNVWLPNEISHQSSLFSFVVRDIDWPDGDSRQPPKSFWIYLSENNEASQTPHTKLEITNCH
jgi:hypothetical protein